MRFVVSWLLALCCVPVLACGQEESMDLEITLGLDREAYLHGESIRWTATLHNKGSAPVEIVSMELDATAAGVELFAADGTSLGLFRWFEAEKRMGENFPGGLEPMVMPLAPGATDEVTHDLLQLREPLPPGDYQLRAVYDHQGKKLTGEPVSFEVRPSKARQFALGNDWSAGQPYHLVVGYADEDAGRLVLMQGSTFDIDHRMFAHMSRIENIPFTVHSQELGASVSLEEARTGDATFVWKEGATLHWRAVGAAASETVGQAYVDLSGWTRIGAPHRDDAQSTVVLLSDASKNEVRALSLKADGTSEEVGKAKTSGAEHLAFAHHRDVGSHVIVGRNVNGRGQVQWVGLGLGEAALVDAPSKVVAVEAGFDRARQPWAVAALSREGAGGVTVQTQILSGAQFGDVSDGPFWDFPSLKSVQLLLGTDGAIYAVATDATDKLWRGDPDGAVSELVDELKPGENPAFLVGRGDVAFGLGAAADGSARLSPIVPYVPAGASE